MRQQALLVDSYNAPAPWDGHLLQRKCACGGGGAGLSGECADCAKKKLLQRRPAVGMSAAATGSTTFSRGAYARGAVGTAVADAISATPTHSDHGASAVDTSTSTGLTGRPGAEAPANVRAAAATGASDIAPDSVHQTLRSAGRPLDPDLRSFFESRIEPHSVGHATGTSSSNSSGIEIGRADDPAERHADAAAAQALSRADTPTHSARLDFSRVRIHNDSAAAESARAIDAQAYTVGSHIVFGAGTYKPRTPAGNELLAHELAHVAQQSSAGSASSQSQAPLRRKGGSVGGFFANIGRAIADLFTGSEPGYDDATLKEYLKGIETSNAIEDDFDSDNKARAVVNKGWANTAKLSTRILLIREMLSGATTDDDENAILHILSVSTPDERKTIGSTITLAALNDSFDGEELDRLYIYYPLMDALHPRRDKVTAHTLEAYIQRWEKEKGLILTLPEKKNLARGCIGITALALTELGRPDLSNCYETFREVLAAQQKMNDFLAQHAPTRRALIFSKRFWSDDNAPKRDPTSGKLDMSGNYPARPGFVNFDYGLYNEKTGKWWHANHCDTTLLAEPKCKGDMVVFESSLAHYSRDLMDFDTQIFCVAITNV